MFDEDVLYWCLAGVCRSDERVERLQGTAAGEGGGDFRVEGRKEQHQSEFTHRLPDTSKNRLCSLTVKQVELAYKKPKI